MNCWNDCPMINKYGVCESALRRVEAVKKCPHRVMRDRQREVFKLDTKRNSSAPKERS